MLIYLYINIKVLAELFVDSWFQKVDYKYNDSTFCRVQMGCFVVIVLGWYIFGQMKPNNEPFFDSSLLKTK